MIKQKELCQKWAMDAGQVSRMVKKGMPLTSEADATKWRLANQQKSFRKAPPLKNEPQEKESQDISSEDLAAISTL